MEHLSLEGLLSFEPEEEKLWWQGVVDYAGSKVNLANLGTYDANNEGTHVPTWGVTTKWNTHHNLWMKTGISGFSGTNKKVILERKYPLYMGV